MKKVLIIIGSIVLVGFTALVIILLFFISEARRYVGPAMYSSLGSAIRIQEYAHATGKTNYIAYADNQVTQIQGWVNNWQRTAGNVDLAKLHEAQTNTYAEVDRGIKSGINPLAFLDDTNYTTTAPLVPAGATNP